MTITPQWYIERIQLWRNLADALNALETAGERPGLNLVKDGDRVVRRYINGENAEVSHSDDAWTIQVYANALAPDAYRPGDRVTYDDAPGTVQEVLPADGEVPVDRVDVQWDNGHRSTVWVSDMMLATP